MFQGSKKLLTEMCQFNREFEISLREVDTFECFGVNHKIRHSRILSNY